jgi:phosphatidylethanolamine-binding protein (PEBP) family uncharacterized protein
MKSNNKYTNKNRPNNTRPNNTRPNNTRPNNTKKNNTKIETLKVSYPDTILQSIKNNQDIKNFSTIYQNAPQVTIQNAKSKLYLITMTDPDAPYGMQNTITTNTKNHTYTHWIYLQDMRNKNNTSTILFKYAPPSPPYGIHRYQFNLYDITNVSQMILDTLKKNINNSLDRNIDYLSTISTINNKNNKSLQPIVKFQYRVNSGKSPLT